MRFSRPIIWTFLPTPLTRDLIMELAPILMIYYCIDDLASSSRLARRVSRSEARIFRDADLVFVTSEKLRERASRYSTQVHLFSFGVSFLEFERVRKGSDEIPGDLKHLTPPIVGYVGGVHQWVDQELLVQLTNQLPEASFVLVGPLQTDISRLAGCPRVHLLGARPHADVPRYIKGFDVGIVPYCLSEYTANVYPTKLNEYLAMGIPVVATDLAEMRRFNAEHGDVLAVTKDAQAFGTAIRNAIDKTTPAETERRIEVARQNSWEQRIARMSELIEAKLTARRAAGENWEKTIRHLYQTARRRIVRTAAGVAIAYLLLFYTPFVWFLAGPLKVVQRPRPTDAIVVFAGGVGESGKAGGGYQERVKQAVDLYHDGIAAGMIFSSGFVFAFQEADVMKILAVSLGVPEEAIILEKKAGSTYENVVFVREILDRHDWRSILLISSPYHMRRALLTWQKVAPRITVIARPVPQSQFYSHSLGANLEQIRGILWEYLAIVLYWWKGWI